MSFDHRCFDGRSGSIEISNGDCARSELNEFEWWASFVRPLAPSIVCLNSISFSFDPSRAHAAPINCPLSRERFFSWFFFKSIITIGCFHVQKIMNETLKAYKMCLAHTKSKQDGNRDLDTCFAGKCRIGSKCPDVRSHQSFCYKQFQLWPRFYGDDHVSFRIKREQNADFSFKKLLNSSIIKLCTPWS